MREVTAKSVKLGRDLDGMLSEALERDLCRKLRRLVVLKISKTYWICVKELILKL